MAAKTAERTRRPVLGKALLTLGGVSLVAQVTLLLWHATQYWDQNGAQAVGGLLAIGMALVHVVNVVAWNPAAALAGTLRVLVSCWPLIVVAAGMVILRKSTTKGRS